MAYVGAYPAPFMNPAIQYITRITKDCVDRGSSSAPILYITFKQTEIESR